MAPNSSLTTCVFTLAHFYYFQYCPPKEAEMSGRLEWRNARTSSLVCRAFLQVSARPCWIPSTIMSNCARNKSQTAQTGSQLWREEKAWLV